MPRTVPEWIAKHDDQPIPPRVKLRVIARADHRCENCGVGIRIGGEIDHRIALILGGEHREKNLRLLCRNCHAAKTKADVHYKAVAAKAKKRMAGIKPPSQLAKQYARVKEKYRFDWRLHRWVPKT